MIKSIEVPCSRCGKKIVAQYDHDPENPVPIHWLDKLARCLACDECMVNMRMMSVKDYREGKQLPLLSPPKPHHEPPKESGLPYKDE